MFQDIQFSCECQQLSAFYIVLPIPPLSCKAPLAPQLGQRQRCLAGLLIAGLLQVLSLYQHALDPVLSVVSSPNPQITYRFLWKFVVKYQLHYNLKNLYNNKKHYLWTTHKHIPVYTLTGHLLRYTLQVTGWTRFCFQNCLNSLWHRFNKVLNLCHNELRHRFIVA